jgi:hypothetical protein
MKNMTLPVRAALALAALSCLAAVPQDAAAFRMIQNTTVGRVSAGSAVPCDHSGGFAHWTNSAISWRHNLGNQGSNKATALQNAMQSWTAVGGASHSLSYAGTTTAGFTTDGINTLLWARGNGCNGSCLAITALVLASGQVITESDISFNNRYTWNTNGSNYDTEAVAAHELGHSLGIHHTELTSTPRPTMYASYFGTDGRTLENDDASALQCSQNRYPPALMEFANSPAGTPDETLAPRAQRLASRPRDGGALVRFALATEDQVTLTVYDVAGRSLATLASGVLPAGEHEIAWDGESRGGKAPSGVYFARLVTARGGVSTATVILAE